jgi:uncharacterized protein YneF (UPF0154 family)
MITSAKKASDPSHKVNGGVGIRILWIILSLIIIALAIGYFLGTQQKNQERYSRKAMEISEYGLMCVLETLEKKPSWTEGFAKIPSEGGWYSTKLSRRQKGDTTLCAIEAIGHIGGVSKRSECLLRLSIVNGDSTWTKCGP